MKLIVCANPEQVALAQALRYEVFCCEKGWVDPASCPHGLEIDADDDRAMHFLVTHDDGSVIGASRLLLGSVQPLPTAQFLDLAALGIDANTTVEVSRMATVRGSRSHDLGVWLALTKVMWQWSTQHGMCVWVSTADVSLFVLMKRSGMPIIATGERVEYLGSMCVPSAVDMEGTREVLRRRGLLDASSAV